MADPNFALWPIVEHEVRRVEYGEEVDEPDYMSELPEIDTGEDPNDPEVRIAIAKHLRFIDYLDYNDHRRMVTWDFVNEPIPSMPANKENTQQAVEDYFVRATRMCTFPGHFLNKYYDYTDPPPIGSLISADEYNLYKARIICDRGGVHIPPMSSLSQSRIYVAFMKAKAELQDVRRGLPYDPAPPYIFDPIFNEETNSYEVMPIEDTLEPLYQTLHI